MRDQTCKIIDAIAIPIGISTSYKVEAMTTLYTMTLVVETSYQNLWMERDSLNIINMPNNKIPITWSIEASLIEIKNLMDKFDKVIFSHTFHEGNSMAD